MLKISFIVPCKNEEKYISFCIDSLLSQEGVKIEREIIVIDNGSTDNTLGILKNYNEEIKFFVCPNLTIAGLRNFGVENSKYDWIAFIDADVELDKYWGRMLLEFIEGKKKNGEDVRNIITGSTCLVPNNPTWIETIWYEQLIIRDSSKINYINSGNMVIHRELFNKIGGFDISFKTGEEENLCAEARNRYDGVIYKNNNMKAIHYGYPKSITAFFQRMRWHGKGMSKYLLAPWKSKPLLLASYYILLSTIFVALSLTDNRHIHIYFVLFVLFQILPVMFYSYSRCNNNIKNAVLLTVLYICFGWARVISIADMIFARNSYHST